jgi:hypothetical protein
LSPQCQKQPKVNGKLYSSFEIVLEDGSDAIKTLRMLHAQLSDILAAFNSLLQP